MTKIKVEFTQELYKLVSRKLVDAISYYNNQLNHYTMALSVPVVGDGEEQVSTVKTLEYLSEYSFAMSKLSTVLHSLEQSYDGANVKAKLVLEVERDSVVMLREFVMESMIDHQNKLNDAMFKLQTVVQLKQPILDGGSPSSVAQIIAESSAELKSHGELMVILETAMESHFNDLAKASGGKLQLASKALN
jgi:hypothetical protein